MTTTRQNPRGRNARGEHSLQRILDATVELVGRYGYDNTTIARITQSTRLPASSIYWHFEDKDDLIAKALESSYTKFTRSGRGWQHLDESVTVQRQLTDAFRSDLRTSESEAPLRLGIMLALEGGAAQSKVQEPFRRRRAGALGSIEQWWSTAFDTHRAGEGDDRQHAWWMSTLTLAFLDGHYIADVAADDTAVDARSRAVASALASAFDALRSGAISALEVPAADSNTPGTVPDTGADPTDLLCATRDLVAERGYEGATIGRICTATGMQRSSVYWRHKDKDALIRAAVAEPFVALFAALHDLPASPGDWVHDLATSVVTVLRQAHAEPNTVKAGLLLAVQTWEPHTSGAAVLEGTAVTEQVLAEWFSAALPGPEGENLGIHLAWTAMRLLEGLMFGSVSGRRHDPDVMHSLLESMFAGLVARWSAPT